MMLVQKTGAIDIYSIRVSVLYNHNSILSGGNWHENFCFRPS